MRTPRALPAVSRRQALRGAASAVAALGWARSGVPASRHISLSERGGAVWATTVRVTGRTTRGVTLTVNGAHVDVDIDGDDFTALVPLQPGENLVEASAGGESAVAAYDCLLLPHPSATPGETDPPPVADEVVYGVIPFAFGYRGFADVRAALARLQALGVTTLWMSPVFQTLRYEFGYAVTDYFAIRNDYGGREELAELVDAAHARGMRVLLDVAANHTSARHPYFRAAERRGGRSHQYGYYQRDRHEDPVHYFDWADLPNLDYDNPEVRTWMSEVVTYWVRELGVDGYRFDAAWGVRQRRPDAWPELLADLRRLEPGLTLLAEASARDPYYRRTGFDLAYDWTDELGEWAWHDVFGADERLVERLDAAVSAAPGTDVFRFLNNNDTGARFIDRYGVGMTRVAAALLLTLPGVPCVYCGDEVGAELDPYETYGPIDWTAHQELREWYRQLIAVRAALPPLRSASWARLSATPAQTLYAYARQEVVVVLNFGSSPALGEVRVAAAGPYVDQLTDEQVDPAAVEVPAYGALVLVPVASVVG